MNNDLEKLEQYILYLVERSKSHTPTEMILGNIPHSTIINFNYGLYKNPLGINSITLKKIVERIDELEEDTHYYDTLCEYIKSFVEENILIGSIPFLTNEMGLNYTTLHKIKDYTLATPYRLMTLKTYAEKVSMKKEGINNENNK